MTPLDRIKKAKISIMRHKKFCAYSGIIACGDWIIDDSIPTAYTDGWGARFNSKFVTELTDPQLRLLLLHEATHSAYNQLTVWRSLWEENKLLTNIAADHFVNLSLMDTDAGEGFIKMPEKGIQPEARFRGMSVKQIFDLLKDEQPPQEASGEPGDGMDQHDWEGAGKGDPKEQQARAEEIQHALRQGELLAKKKIGKGAGGADGVFSDLLTPKVNWRQVLREFVTENCAGRDESSWQRPNRRFLADDIYLPSLVGMTMAELVVVFDTSGSCFGGDDMARFVTELGTVIEQVKPGKCHVLYTDTQVAGHQVFEDGQFAVQSLKVKGGGGTNLPVAFDYCKEKNINPTACVILTDGDTPFGNPPGYPVLWASTSKGRHSPWGTNISIAD